jgi:apolipoprotein N-acyltransferase
MSFNQSGPAKQPPIVFRDRALSLSICYEVAYPELVRQTADEFSVLVTVSNDTWFGDSLGPFQHLQIAQMRARELGRSLFRVTNNGITALVTPDGVVERQLPKNVADVLVAEVPLYRGRTPYGRLGQWPLLVLIGSGLLAFVYLKVKTQALVSRRSRP